MIRAVALMMALLWAQSAHALTCKQVRDAIAQYGENLTLLWARNNGYSEKQITEIRRVCKIR